MADFVGPIWGVVIEFISSRVIKFLNYKRKFDQYMKDFEEAERDLNGRKADIEQQLQDEHHIRKKPKLEVETWLKKAEEKLLHAQHVKEATKGKYLFLSFRGKLVDEATEAMKKVRAEGVFSGSLVVNDLSIMAVNLPTTELVGDSNVREEIYQYLMGDKVGKIGVCGMGGIGKTTIMKDVHNRILKEDKFRKLIWATVSQDFDIRRIQNNIASQLAENFSNDEETTLRAGELSQMLRKQGRYVLILDDVWEWFSLESVGILEPTVDNGCKLVLTTRLERVVLSMGCKKVQVAPLSHDEAMQLFLKELGQEMLPNQPLRPTMELVVRECDGLPLAIVTVAGCMKGISELPFWENALIELRGCIKRSLDYMEDKVFGCLKFSYYHLQRKDRDCFLYCALYPEDHEIIKEGIIEYWIEEGLIDEMGSRKAMEDSGHSILRKLEENCLLEAKGGKRVKMHDVVRDMALHITRQRFLVKAGAQLRGLLNAEEWGEDLEKVSLMDNYISTIPQNMKLPKFQKLTTLLLLRNYLKEIPESFFEHFPNLRILDLSYNPIQNLPNSISSLQKLITLLLVACYDLKSLPSLSKLQALRKLDLQGCGIKEIPQGLEMLVNLRYLNLKYTSIEMPPGLLSKLCHLQFLSTRPTSIKAEEIRELKRLEVFESRFSEVGDLTIYAAQRKDLYKYFIWVRPEDAIWLNKVYDYSKIVVFEGIEINSGDEIVLPYDVQVLEVKECEGMRSLNDIGVRDAVDLKECSIDDCDDLEFVFSSNCHQLQTLESLYLDGSKNLKVIVGGEESPVGTFSFLKKISLLRCEQIKNLLSDNWDLLNLEEISVWHCEQMEEIIVPREKVGAITFSLPKLRRLILGDLPELKSIYGENGVMACDSLQFIRIANCPKLKRIPLHLPLLEGKPSPPPSLQEIQVDPKEWWESMEWDHPNPDAKNVPLPLHKFWDEGWTSAV